MKNDAKKSKEGNGKKPEKKGFMGILIVVFLAIAVASFANHLDDAKHADTKDVSLTQLEQNFKDKKYSEILID